MEVPPNQPNFDKFNVETIWNHVFFSDVHSFCSNLQLISWKTGRSFTTFSPFSPSVGTQVVLGALIDALEQCREAATSEADAAAASALIKQHKETLEAPRIGESPYGKDQVVILDMIMKIYFGKSAHTALAVKACLLGGNSNTKCSMTFVNIAVAISALAGGGAKTVSHRDLTPKTVSHRDQPGGVFDFTAKNEKNIVHSTILPKYPVIYSGFCSLCSKTSFFTGFRALRRRRIAPWRC